MKLCALRRTFITSLLLLGFSSAAQAYSLMEGLVFKPYFGYEFQYEHIDGNESWGLFMPANFQYNVFFVGTRYHPNFGLEVAYFHTFRNRQASVYMDAFNGSADPTGTTLVIGQMTDQGFMFDWDVYFPLDPKFNFMVSVGVITYHPNFSISTSGGTAIAEVLPGVTPRNKAVLRLGAGLEYEAKHWGARTRVLWSQTQKITVNLNNPNAAALGIQNRPFKQAVAVTAGIFYIF